MSSPINIWEDVIVNKEFVLVKIDGNKLHLARTHLFQLSDYKNKGVTATNISKKLLLGDKHTQKFYREGNPLIQMYSLDDLSHLYHAYPNMRNLIRDVLQEILTLLKSDIYFQGVVGAERKAMKKQLKKFLKKPISV